MTTSTKRRLADFAGHWQVARRIVPDAGPPARFDGTAVWTPEADGLAYHEQGRMQIGGHAPMHAERRYFWAADLAVFFEDGRFFHTVPAAGGLVRHLCPPDDYVLIYDFAEWPAFEVRWLVSGPRKAYRATTLYRLL